MECNRGCVPKFTAIIEDLYSSCYQLKIFSTVSTSSTISERAPSYRARPTKAEVGWRFNCTVGSRAGGHTWKSRLNPRFVARSRKEIETGQIQDVAQLLRNKVRYRESRYVSTSEHWNRGVAFGRWWCNVDVWEKWYSTGNLTIQYLASADSCGKLCVDS